MSGWARTIPKFVPGAEGDVSKSRCRDKGGPFLCSRDFGHPGRHLASVGDDLIAAAWPGDHEPSAADLTDGGA